MDTFFLFKKGDAYPYMHQRLKFQGPQCKAEFSLSAVTPNIGGIFTCFGSQSSSPYLLSHPSVPVEIKVSGEVILACVSSESNPLFMIKKAFASHRKKFNTGMVIRRD